MLGFLRRHLHRHVRRNIHRTWMQWTIRLYEGVTTFLHGLLWFTGLLFLSGHIAASAVQALDLGHMGWQELLALASIPSGLLALYSMYTAYNRGWGRTRERVHGEGRHRRDGDPPGRAVQGVNGGSFAPTFAGPAPN